MTSVNTNNTVSNELLATMNPSKKDSTSSIDGAQDRFMTLLVTQMKNQDPLNPMDNSQVTSQLAQLSTVTGIDKMNATLESLMSSVTTNQTMQATGMIGHNIYAAGSNLTLASGKAQFGVQLPEGADSVKVSIRDGSGSVVRTMDLGAKDAGIVPMQWDGKTDKGVVAADGHYTFSIDATTAGQKANSTALSFGAVSSVSSGSSGVKLNVTGVGEVNQTDVVQIL